MDANEIVSPFINKVNLILGSVAALLSYFLGDQWVLFVGFLGLNVADYITGYIKSGLGKKVNSHKGVMGILKKFAYWIVITVAFGMSTLLMQMGKTIGVDLSFMNLLGYFVLAALMINELLSIFENLAEAGIWVPKIIKKFLLVANKAFEAASGTEEEQKDD